MGSSETRFPIKIVLKINGGLGLRDFTLSPTGSNPSCHSTGARSGLSYVLHLPQEFEAFLRSEWGSFQPRFLERTTQGKVKVMGRTAFSFLLLSPPLGCLPFPRSLPCLFANPSPRQKARSAWCSDCGSHYMTGEHRGSFKSLRN